MKDWPQWDHGKQRSVGNTMLAELYNTDQGFFHCSVGSRHLPFGAFRALPTCQALEESLIEEAQRGVLTKFWGTKTCRGWGFGREAWIQSQAATSIWFKSIATENTTQKKGPHFRSPFFGKGHGRKIPGAILEGSFFRLVKFFISFACKSLVILRDFQVFGYCSHISWALTFGGGFLW